MASSGVESGHSGMFLSPLTNWPPFFVVFVCRLLLPVSAAFVARGRRASVARVPSFGGGGALSSLSGGLRPALGVLAAGAKRLRRSAPRSSTPLHQPTAAEMAPNPPGSVSGTSPAGLRWWAAVVGLFWCCRLPDGLAAPHCRSARTATPGSSGVSAVPVMLCRAVAATVKCLGT